MPTYPSPKPTLPLTSHLEQNVALGKRVTKHQSDRSWISRVLKG